MTISNAVSLVESAHVTLNILADTSAPVLISAERTAPTQVFVNFSERVSENTATNVPNYTLTNLAGGLVKIFQIVRVTSSNVVLTTDGLSPGSNYVLMANNVQDISRYTNSAFTATPVAGWLPLLNEYDFWYFYNPYIQQNPPGPGDDNPDLGVSWRMPD